MSKIQIVGSGGCGLMRAYDMLRGHVPISFKWGKRKFQNYFEVWDPHKDLIWDSERYDKEHRKCLIRELGLENNISHIAIKYVQEYLEIDPSVKFICLKGERDFSINCLLTSWGYRNPCFVTDRTLGIGHNRYPVEQFPNFSDSCDELEATTRYWDEYYKIADDCQRKFPNEFIVVDAQRFFSDEDYQKKSLLHLGLSIPFYDNPADYEKFDVSTTLHGGLGNNLFQMAEALSFCEKFNLPRPFFGTWEIPESPAFPSFYNADRFLGGHDGNQGDMKKTFPDLDWRTGLKADLDVKFVVNDMFRFGELKVLSKVRDSFRMNISSESQQASLHLRFCTRGADDHVNGMVGDAFYDEAIPQIPEGVKILVFSDDLGLAHQQVDKLRGRFNREFEILDLDAFRSLELMASCKYNLMHVSTFSFWGAFLGASGVTKTVFCPSSFITAHGPKMISPDYGWKII